MKQSRETPKTCWAGFDQQPHFHLHKLWGDTLLFVFSPLNHDVTTGLWSRWPSNVADGQKTFHPLNEWESGGWTDDWQHELFPENLRSCLQFSLLIFNHGCLLLPPRRFLVLPAARWLKTIHSFTGNQNLQTFLINTCEEVVSVRCSLCFSPRICLFDASFRATLSCFNTSKQSSAQIDPVESKIFRTWRFLPCFYGYVRPFRESHVDSFKSNRVEQLFPKHRLWLSLLYPGAEPVLITT